MKKAPTKAELDAPKPEPKPEPIAETVEEVKDLETIQEDDEDLRESTKKPIDTSLLKGSTFGT